MERMSSTIPVSVVMAVVVMVVMMIRRLLLARLVNGCSLGDTVIVALPDDVGIGWKRQQPLDGFATRGQR